MPNKASQVDKDYKDIQTLKLNVIEEFQLDGEEVTATAAEINSISGLTANSSELNLLVKQAASIVFNVGTESGNAINVGLQVLDALGLNITAATALRFYLANDANGLIPSTSPPSLGISIATDGALIVSIADLSGTIVTDVNGAVDIDISDILSPTFYLVVVMPNGSLQVSPAIAFT